MKAIRKYVSCSLLFIGIIIVNACQPSTSVPVRKFEASEQGKIAVSEFMIVDCLLPGTQRRLGGVVYLSPRRPQRLQARECAIRGGEYVVYDQANYQTALQIWQTKANAGDPQAQTYVGEIYEKGLGTAPDYGMAFQWYRKAAEQGYTRAQINLGHLYESGLGVPKDMTEAIRWYRMGAGLPESLAIQGFISDGSSNKAVEALKKEIERLQKELREVRQKLRESSQRRDLSNDLQQKIISLETQLEELRTQKNRSGRAKIPKLPAMDKGDYYALIIGNNTYADQKNFPELQTAINDARELKRILIEKYQFKQNAIKLLVDAKYKEIFEALAFFKKRLGIHDKFLIYYAGHGIYDELNDVGHWLPVDANKEVEAFWISNEQITRQINGIQARHVLVIADSCYSGTMTDFAILHPRAGMPANELQYMVKTLVEKHSRTVLTSGSLTPVFDTGGGRHSVFAEVLLKILIKNQDIIAGKDLYNEVFPRVSSKSQELFGKKQEPDYGALRGAGHRAGDFFFVPRSTVAVSTVNLGPELSEQF